MVQIAQIKLASIKPNPKNPSLIRDSRFKKLVQSIKQFPKMMDLRPIVIDKTKIIIGGNQRYQALLELGYTEVPANWIKAANDLTEEERRRFILMDNTQFGEHDWDMLANEWDRAEIIEWGMEIPSIIAPPAVSFTPAEKTGLKMKITFTDQEQVKKISAQLDKMGITGYKIS